MLHRARRCLQYFLCLVQLFNLIKPLNCNLSLILISYKITTKIVCTVIMTNATEMVIKTIILKNVLEKKSLLNGTWGIFEKEIKYHRG